MDRKEPRYKSPTLLLLYFTLYNTVLNYSRIRRKDGDDLCVTEAVDIGPQ